MPRFDAQAIAEIVLMTQEMLADAGFTGVKIEPAPLSEETIKALEASAEDDEIPFRDPAFATELHNHRVTTDQGTFGIWFEPYVTLSLAGLGLDAKIFSPPDADDEDMPEGWCLIGIGEGTLERLFIELTKKQRQP